MAALWRNLNFHNMDCRWYDKKLISHNIWSCGTYWTVASRFSTNWTVKHLQTVMSIFELAETVETRSWQTNINFDNNTQALIKKDPVIALLKQ